MAGDDQWVAWHTQYEDADSSLSHRLRIVQRRLSEALDRTAAGPIRLLSMCAGEGRDVCGVLTTHGRKADVVAHLVESDPVLTARARHRAALGRLPQVHVVEGDASSTDVYVTIAPVEVLLMCGLFGNIRDTDIERTIAALPSLCVRHATVIWTRHRREPDLTSTIRGWLAGAEFAEVAFDTEEPFSFAVGTARFTGRPQVLRRRQRLFDFVGGGDAAAR